ncbi:MAG: hypothetical protein OXC96_06745, partial [Cyanobacteria bacterium MAG CAR1_bin_15]|nr:hypothetical protein [Cyanobacteria bacterium MAG CAR1_bin_15]
NVAVGSGVFVCVEVSESGGDRLAAGAGREEIFVAGFTDGAMAFAPTLGTWENDAVNERPSRVTIRLLPPSDSRCSGIGAAGYVVTPRGEDKEFSFIIAEDDDLSVGLTSADDRMTEGVAAATATVTVELDRRLYAGESAEVVLDLSSSTGAALPDGDAMTKDDFVVTAAGTGVTGEGLDDDRLTLVFTGDDSATVQTATLTFTPTDRDDGDTTEDTVTVALNTSNSAIRPGEAGLSGSPNSVNLTLEEQPGDHHEHRRHIDDSVGGGRCGLQGRGESRRCGVFGVHVDGESGAVLPADGESGGSGRRGCGLRAARQ